MKKPKKNPVNRRSFLTGAVTGAAALIAKPAIAAAAPQQAPARAEVADEGRPGSDFMVDVFKSLGFEYLFAMPGGSFGGIHESVINYGNNQKPEFITCMHEESSVAMANGYAKIEGKPVLVCVHGTVGLQHATMAIYDAWCDRVPIYVVGGNTLDAARRGGEVAWVHSVQDTCAIVRDITKWDDNPVSLTHFAESAVRAYKIAMTPPMGPVALVADTELQNDRVPNGANLRVPRLSPSAPPQGDSGAVAEAAKLLVAAENPVIVASRAVQSAAGMKLLIELAETLQAGVVDQHRRLNFPTQHPLNQSLRAGPAGKPQTGPAVNEADVILALESGELYSTVRQARQRNNPAKLINISAGDLFLKSNYQNFMRYTEVDVSMAADVEATLPALIEAVKRQITADRRRVFDARRSRLAEAGRRALERTRTDASYGWEASPISTARLCAELWAQIKNEDWSLVTESFWVREWPLRLWNFDRHYQYIGGAGGEGVGYTAPAAIGAAVANKKYGRLTVAIQPDGDLMVANGVLWTAAHHRIPILMVMHNNRAYHQEVMGIQGVANRRNRGVDRIHIGTTIDDPNIDYAKLAQSMGMRAEGPIGNPRDLSAALRRGIDVVKRGEPYLIDVLTQPR
ncbi:MAG TPA: thiamine pyrophosphate-dependent enzyme [Terriglobia bacterium]|nr:thiamine pyrophosphate-dependent enzyme [Terriglobia bacterium]